MDGRKSWRALKYLKVKLGCSSPIFSNKTSLCMLYATNLIYLCGNKFSSEDSSAQPGTSATPLPSVGGPEHNLMILRNFIFPSLISISYIGSHSFIQLFAHFIVA